MPELTGRRREILLSGIAAPVKPERLQREIKDKGECAEPPPSRLNQPLRGGQHLGGTPTPFNPFFRVTEDIKLISQQIAGLSPIELLVILKTSWYQVKLIPFLTWFLNPPRGLFLCVCVFL